MRYAVASVDAIVEFGDWAINDLSQIGSIDINSLVLDDDQRILDVLNICGYTQDLTINDTEIDGDGECMTLLDSETGRPLYQLILET